MKKAFGIIDLLLGFLIISITFCALIKFFYPTQLLKDSEEQTLQEQVDMRINEIELLREKSIEAQNNLTF